MKKILILLVLFLVSLNSFADELIFTTGIKDNCNTQLVINDEKNFAASSHFYNFSIDYYYQVNKYIFLGAGIKANTQQKLADDLYITTYPIYVSAKIKGKNKTLTPYIGLKLGKLYGSFNESSEYYLNYKFNNKKTNFIMLNTGLELNENLMIEVFWEKLNYKYSAESWTVTNGYPVPDIAVSAKSSNVGLNIGYKFNM